MQVVKFLHIECLKAYQVCKEHIPCIDERVLRIRFFIVWPSWLPLFVS